jgi:fluoride exporter
VSVAGGAQLLAVARGGAAGCGARFGVGQWLQPRLVAFPLGTLVVNVSGGLAIGAALAWFERQPNEWLRLALVTGFCGGYTTFSAFSAESLQLIQRGELGLALLHTLAHVVGALLAAAVGYRLLRTVLA